MNAGFSTKPGWAQSPALLHVEPDNAKSTMAGNFFRVVLSVPDGVPNSGGRGGSVQQPCPQGDIAHHPQPRANILTGLITPTGPSLQFPVIRSGALPPDAPRSPSGLRGQLTMTMARAFVHGAQVSQYQQKGDGELCAPRPRTSRPSGCRCYFVSSTRSTDGTPLTRSDTR
ncbi:MAG: hypothetical protein JWQ98_2928 [Chlorobi bacterium]|nr:hypothetical protein [Chlorobiota bacterium]